jgi:aspartokinase-like uncharacterized kinase
MPGAEIRSLTGVEPVAPGATRTIASDSVRSEAASFSVVKIGGSLLTWPDLPTCLVDFLQSRVNERHVLIVGGGTLVDEIRRLDALHGIGEFAAHWLAIRALDVTARILQTLIFGLEVVEDRAGRDRAWAKSCVPILAPRAFLQEDAKLAGPLPETWSVTSDSIAARVAERWNAAGLVLLKSAPLASDMTCREAAELGVVDAFFPLASRHLRNVSYLNVRGDGGKPVLLATGD